MIRRLSIDVILAILGVLVTAWGFLFPSGSRPGLATVRRWRRGLWGWSWEVRDWSNQVLERGRAVDRESAERQANTWGDVHDAQSRSRLQASRFRLAGAIEAG